MVSKSSAGPFFSRARRETAPISRSQSTSARMRRSSFSFSSSASQPLRSMKPLVIIGLRPRPASAASIGRHDFVQEARELAALVPRAQAQRHVAEPGVRIGAQLPRARLRVAGDGPLLDEFRSEVGRVIRVEEFLGLLQRSEEHTSELQSHSDLVCRLLLEKKKKYQQRVRSTAAHEETQAPAAA